MYKKYFNEDGLIKAYQKIKIGKLSTGIDRVNRATFEKLKGQALKEVSNKILNGTYFPTPYREVLIVKNAESCPRRLSIPTIRDKIIMEVLKEILKDKYTPIIEEETVPDIVCKIGGVIKSKKYDGYIKLDIKGYYDCIVHDTLLKRVKQTINSSFVVNLVSLFIKNITIADGSKKEGREKSNNLGVPQGISISNILGNIYLKPLDSRYYKSKGIVYFRYVDDILVFCKYSKIEETLNKIISVLGSKEFELSINSKKEYGEIKEFNFLGYNFDENGVIGIADKNIKKIENSLEKIFSDFRSSHDKRIKGNYDLLEWKLNFRITGCFKDKKRYGWVIFFSRNEREIIMHHLDWLVVKLCKRFGVDALLNKDGEFIGKSFVKTYIEYSTKQDNTKYIPTIDNFSSTEKRYILHKVCHRNYKWVHSLPLYLLEKEFDRFIFSSIRDIEKDLNQIYG
ncbi:reverse transcriptase domain-containing protein [Anoxybacterium hadale]|uniref:reverse transcriptase domain-containing protein n=1 Tax=Anoxybacterium hadale TaxID=3408580 RepID=UPI003B000679